MFDLVKKKFVDQERVMRARWVLTWKSTGKEQARRCVLGFQDPDLTEVPRDSPTLSTASEALIVRWVASHMFRLISFFSNETCMDLLASCGKDSLRKFYWDSNGKYRIGNACVFIEKRIVLIRMTFYGWKKAEYGSHVEEIDETCGSWRTNIVS